MLRALTVLLASLTFNAYTARAGVVGDLPDAIICSVEDPTGILTWDELVFFVSAHTRDGDTLYKSLTSGPVLLIVDAAGTINAPNLVDCDGRNVKDLLEAGRAYDLTKS